MPCVAALAMVSAARSRMKQVSMAITTHSAMEEGALLLLLRGLGTSPSTPTPLRRIACTVLLGLGLGSGLGSGVGSVVRVRIRVRARTPLRRMACTVLSMCTVSMLGVITR
eukprot:scaffold3277_cov38-Phaeocystis_antarctica.AAC.1